MAAAGIWLLAAPQQYSAVLPLRIHSTASPAEFTQAHRGQLLSPHLLDDFDAGRFSAEWRSAVADGRVTLQLRGSTGLEGQVDPCRPDQCQAIAEAFRRAGYATAAESSCVRPIHPPIGNTVATPGRRTMARRIRTDLLCGPCSEARDGVRITCVISVANRVQKQSNAV